MSDFPDPDEEFELMYGDDLDVLREQEHENLADSRNHARRSLDFSSPAISKTFGSNVNRNASLTASTLNDNIISIDDNVNTENSTLNVSGIEDIPESLPPSQKRTVTDLFGDIDDLDFDEDVYQNSKRSRIESEDDLNAALIERILYERKRRTELSNPVLMLNRDYTVSDNNKIIENISNSIPRWPFITLTKSDGRKLYVRFHDEEYMEREVDEITKSHGDFKSLLGVAFKDSWNEAKAYLESKNMQNKTVDINGDELMVVETEQNAESGDRSQLWVERYKPMRYVELLSDESTNRTLLQWLKMWDKIVFNKEIKIKKPDTSNKFNKRSGKFEFRFNKKTTLNNAQEELFTELDDNHTPKYKVALLCGPPGCGKTTLAHIIAKHAGYKVVEINASDDRSIDAFKMALENATQMKSVLDDQKRPNCLVLDEIDGAPLPTIEYLIKFVSGTASVKPKKGVKARSNILKRPVICICNDVYTPSLRPLRQIAFVVHFPPTEISRLTQRLNEVTIMEGLKVDGAVLSALGEKTHNDIRSCLGVLNFLKSKQKQLRLSDINNIDIGQKDMSKGLFQVWQEIFQIHQPKVKRFEDLKDAAKLKRNNFMNLGDDVADSGNIDTSFKGRSRRILNTVHSAGDYEKLIQGVYENFLSMKVRDSMMLGVNQAFEWFLLTDIFTAFINHNQNYTLMSYIPYSFVCWHLQFASLNWPKIKFPSQGFEVFQKKTQFSGITSGVEKGVCPSTKPFITKTVLILDSLPLLPHIISPSLRPVNVQLYSEKEKREMNTVVGVMLDYGLQYVQERTQDGTYNYVLDPDIYKVGIFNEKNSRVRNLSYALKQLISREVDLEKMKRTELKVAPLNESALQAIKQSNANTSSKSSVQEKNSTPNHLQKLEPKLIKPAVRVSVDFFGQPVRGVEGGNRKEEKKEDKFFRSPTWYHYKEGYNNAVRRKVKIADLL
ncbi:chromosome transmission fidelity protein 18 homolog [Arctopsyche grandis]|uniref:chromosome transmission fidelity protein 18 homolog n=1 Tax=Arctopsyche grandis TaxID=121162 RepID=UPI00406D8E2B